MQFKISHLTIFSAFLIFSVAACSGESSSNSVSQEGGGISISGNSISQEDNSSDGSLFCNGKSESELSESEEEQCRERINEKRQNAEEKLDEKKQDLEKRK